jgi:hypothetical protein
MVTGMQDNQQPDDLEAGEGVYVTTSRGVYFCNELIEHLLLSLF